MDEPRRPVEDPGSRPDRPASRSSRPGTTLGDAPAPRVVPGPLVAPVPRTGVHVTLPRTPSPHPLLLCLLPPGERAGAETLVQAVALLAARTPELTAVLATDLGSAARLGGRLPRLCLAGRARLAGLPTAAGLRAALDRGELVLRPCSAHLPGCTPAVLAEVLACAPPLAGPAPAVPGPAAGTATSAGAGLWLGAAAPARIAAAVGALLDRPPRRRSHPATRTLAPVPAAPR